MTATRKASQTAASSIVRISSDRRIDQPSDRDEDRQPGGRQGEQRREYLHRLDRHGASMRGRERNVAACVAGERIDVPLASPAMTTSSIALREMRRARRTRRLGELEWFEIAYRVYLAALFGGLAVMWLSDLVTDEPVTGDQLADVVDRGPAIIGLVAAAAIALGLRSGSDGGPISLEAGDARHLMLAPIPRPRGAVATSRSADAVRRLRRGGDRGDRRTTRFATTARVRCGVGRQRGRLARAHRSGLRRRRRRRPRPARPPVSGDRPRPPRARRPGCGRRLGMAGTG